MVREFIDFTDNGECQEVELFAYEADEARVEIQSPSGNASFKKAIMIALPEHSNEFITVINNGCSIDDVDKAVKALDVSHFDAPYYKGHKDLEKEIAKLRNQVDDLREENEALRHGRAAGL